MDNIPKMSKDLRVMVMGLLFIPSLLFVCGFVVASMTLNSYHTVPVSQNDVSAEKKTVMSGIGDITPISQASASALDESPIHKAPAVYQNRLITDSTGYSIQVALYRNRGNAIRHADKLRANGYAVEVLLDTQFAMEPLYRVTYGLYSDQTTALLAARLYELKEKHDALVLQRLTMATSRVDS